MKTIGDGVWFVYKPIGTDGKAFEELSSYNYDA